MKHAFPQSTPLTATIVLVGTALVLAVSLTLITAALYMLTHLQLPQLTTSPTF